MGRGEGTHGPGSGRSVLAWLLAVATLLAAPAATVACSSAPIPFDRVLAGDGLVAVVRVVAVRGPADAPDALALAVDDVWRGTAPPVLDIEPPVTTACGDSLWTRAGERLVIAFAVAAFDGIDPLAAYWAVGDDGTLEPRSAEPPPGRTTLAQLRAAFPGSAPEALDEPGAPGGEPAVALAILVLGIAALVLVGTTVLLGRHRPSR